VTVDSLLASSLNLGRANLQKLLDYRWGTTRVVDEPAELKQLARFGLYGVGSNRPGVLIDAIADGLLDR
jgi:hypothetical protein